MESYQVSTCVKALCLFEHIGSYSVYDTLAMENASGSNHRTPKLNTLGNLGTI